MISKISLLFSICLAIPFFVISNGCQKDVLAPTENYIGNFWGLMTPPYYTADTIEFYELNVPLLIKKIDYNTFLVNQEFSLIIFKDSIEGTFIIPNTSYLIDPFIIGNYSIKDGNYYFDGNYAALKDSTHAVRGVFEIIPDL